VDTLTPLEAYEQVLRFAAARGEDALRLAMHAAVPQLLRPELLHLLRLNFVPEALEDQAVEADVLLSPFCRHLGNGYYRFDAHARRHLVKQLDPLYADDHTDRSRRVASFLLSYFDEQGRVLSSSSDAVYATYIEVERWVALAFFDPAVAARQLAGAIRRSSEEHDAVARMRISGLSGALTTPLAQHQTLLAYATGVEALESGNFDQARDLLEPLGDREIAVGDVTLQSPHALLGEWTRQVRESEPELNLIGEEDAQIEPHETVPDEVMRQSIFISYAHADEKWLHKIRTFLEPFVRQHNIEVWSDTDIRPGAEWRAEIRLALARARVAIVLVSPDYLASDFLIETELPELEKTARAGQLTLLWIAVRACNWSHTSLARLQAATDPSQPLETLRSPLQDRALMEVAKAVEGALGVGARQPDVRAHPTADIFLCYRRESEDGRAGRLADNLKAAYGDERVFRDISDIEAGRDFLDVITRTVEASSVMLVVIGRDWLAGHDASGRRLIDNPGDVMRFEVAAALRSGIRVVPILVGGARMPSDEDLPHDLAPLIYRQAIELRDSSWERDFTRLKDALDRVLGDSSLAAAFVSIRR
jgi:TIR domain